MQKEFAFCYKVFSPGIRESKQKSDATKQGKGCLPEKTQSENKVWLLPYVGNVHLYFSFTFHPASAPMS